MTNEEAALLRRLMSKIDELDAKVLATRQQQGENISLPGQYPGKPIPHTESVEIAITATTNVQQGNITIAADGPYYATSIVAGFRPTAGTTGQWRPLASSGSPDVAAIDDVINFYWEYQTSGSHRNRQNLPIPSSVLERAQDGVGRFDLAVPDVFQPTTTITVRITPSVAPGNAGVLWFGFHGFYSLE